MSLVAFIHLIGSLGVLPSRAFLPAFATALLLRFGPTLPLFQNAAILKAVSGPSWFTHDYTLIALGILATAEVIATKDAEMRGWLDEFDQYAKSALALITTFGLISATDRKIIDVIQKAGMADYILPVMAAAGVFFLAEVRQSVLGVLRSMDEDDDLGIQRLISWLEDLWVLYGLLIVFLFPFVMLILVALFWGALLVLRRYLLAREEKAKIACPYCAKPNLPAALRCVSCKQDLPAPHALGLLGQALHELAPNRDAHALQLISKKRCPSCAARLHERVPRQKCNACGTEVLAPPISAENYVAAVSERVPKTLTVAALVGLLPIVGLIPGIIYYRLTLIAPFRQYIPFKAGCLAKVAVKVLNFVLILLQPIPLVGALLLPLMAYTNFLVYRSAYLQAAQNNPGV